MRSVPVGGRLGQPEQPHHTHRNSHGKTPPRGHAYREEPKRWQHTSQRQQLHSRRVRAGRSGRAQIRCSLPVVHSGCRQKRKRFGFRRDRRIPTLLRWGVDRPNVREAEIFDFIARGTVGRPCSSAHPRLSREIQSPTTPDKAVRLSSMDGRFTPWSGWDAQLADWAGQVLFCRTP
ncbi:MAG: hypothetical protein ACI9TH_003368 [Kiritimatiellia bacterium]|jgi:hypothetical protein